MNISEYAMPALHKVNRGYQITIPKTIREQIDLHIGDHVLIDVVEDEIRLRPVQAISKSPSDVSQRFWKDLDEGVSLSVTEEEIAEEVRAYRVQRGNKT